jgi:hypothetical protein
VLAVSVGTPGVGDMYRVAGPNTFTGSGQDPAAGPAPGREEISP